ncbi:DUF397 domain-containing protein [Actinomadura darangshiensis]|uniref:DUF397 domain-containing protein n=1 Tax=Actinomadura darangshiensis TaxID=705336 RepID=A0A4R5AW75_9ACTN|nr:DUF397 domain-containing protein [Actinomadura darangshiensis]
MPARHGRVSPQVSAPTAVRAPSCPADPPGTSVLADTSTPLHHPAECSSCAARPTTRSHGAALRSFLAAASNRAPPHRAGTVVAVRDSKDPDGPVLLLTRVALRTAVQSAADTR